MPKVSRALPEPQMAPRVVAKKKVKPALAKTEMVKPKRQKGTVKRALSSK